MADDTALVIIDVQRAMFDESDPVFQGEQLLGNIQKLIVSARDAGHRVIYIQHSEGAGSPLEHGTAGWEIHPFIVPLEGDLIVEKGTPDSFHETNLHTKLQEFGVSRLILAGMQTELCVDTTCRRAFSLGYKVQLIRNAHSTWNSSLLRADQIIEHHNSVLSMFAHVVDLADVTR